MRKLQAVYLLLSLLITSQLKSQSKRFYYEFRYITDSLKTDSISSEIMQLDIFKIHSEFLSSQQAIRDSSIFNIKQKSNEIGSNLKQGNVKIKIYKGKENYSQEWVGIENFKIPFNRNQNWNISSETKKILNYNCQKATITLNGRNWIAWFTSEIPIQNGPYIFMNLPGLIVEIKDSEEFFSFSLIGNKTIKNSSPNISFTNRIQIPKISREQFNKKWIIFRKDPIGFREQWVITNPNIMNPQYYDANGNLLNKDKVYREDREKIKEQISKNNVFIDKKLYK